ncbi:hypothetical protein [Vibrio sp. Hal054]|uniref:hypothetical protein n=1 Tax=Vibrio sp. Hal054 TaxID=3035158 RepID=UPI00301B77FB
MTMTLDLLAKQSLEAAMSITGADAKDPHTQNVAFDLACVAMAEEVAKRHSNILVTSIDMNNDSNKLTLVKTAINAELRMTNPLSDADALTLLGDCDCDTSNRLVIGAVRTAIEKQGFTVPKILFDGSEGTYSLSVSHDEYGHGFIIVEVNEAH